MKCLLGTRSIATETPVAREIPLSDKDGKKYEKNTRKARRAFFFFQPSDLLEGRFQQVNLRQKQHCHGQPQAKRR
jgi:hypothetical protein